MMIANHIHDALAQVRELQQKILEKQRFKGYSGRARALAGTLALLAAILMSAPFFPKDTSPHLMGWGVVFAFGFAINYGALLHWFLFDPSAKRDFRRLRPAIDAFPPLLVGGILTLVMILNDQHQFLFGIWMCLFGLTSLASRPVLPKLIWAVGFFYIISGAIYLLSPNKSFLNPWPMGIIFFVGEWFGGIVLHFDDKFGRGFRDEI
jgi:hypothetical protein